MKRGLQVLAAGKVFEGPRWRDGRWWVSDFYRQGVYAITPEGHSEKIWHVGQQPSGIGWMPDGSLLVVSMKDKRILRRSQQGEVSVHADLSQYCGGSANIWLSIIMVARSSEISVLISWAAHQRRRHR